MATTRRGRKTRRNPPIKKRVRTTTGGRTSRQAIRALGDAVQNVAARILPAGATDAVRLLEKDHRRFEKLLERGEKTTARANKRRVEILRTLAAELALHEIKEEKIFYPALKRHPDARAIVLEGYQEHHVADVLVEELQNMPPHDERWGAKFKVLKESLEHHIEEEEGEMFKTARSALGRQRLNELGIRMQAMSNPGRKRPRAR